MGKFGFRKLMIFIILSATVAIAYQIPYLRYTFYDQMMEVLKLNNTQMGDHGYSGISDQHFMLSHRRFFR